MKLLPLLLGLALAPLATGALAQGGDEPQDAVMVHVDGAAGSTRFIPDRIVIVPGGTVQLMIFGQSHGRYSLTLEDIPGREAEVDTASPGVVHVAEFAAPTAPGEYAFHDKNHPEATGLLFVRPTDGTTATTSGLPTIGVGNGYDTRFYPARLEVSPGGTVRFTNNASEIIHTMTALDGSFDADAVRAGEERTITAPTTAGEYDFICKYHEGTGMRGVLVVGAGEAPPATPPAGPASAPNESTGSGREVPAAPWVLLASAIAAAALALLRHRRAR